MKDKNPKQPKKDPMIKDPAEHQKNEDAFEQAEKDIDKDPEMDLDNESDLDEGELARKEGHP